MNKLKVGRKLGLEKLDDRMMMAADTVVERPISDWIEAQQDTGYWGNDADVNRDNVVGSSPADQYPYGLQFDWFGLQNKQENLGLNTQVTGSVRQRQVGDIDGDGDDDVLVTVDMHTKNANIVVWDTDFSTVLMGDDPLDNVAQDAALASIDLRLEFYIDEMGGDLPSFGPWSDGTSGSLLDQDFLVGGDVLPQTHRFQLNIKAEGPLTAAGAEHFGVKEGSKAQLHWAKPGLYDIPIVAGDVLGSYFGYGRNRGAGRVYPSSGFVFRPTN